MAYLITKNYSPLIQQVIIQESRRNERKNKVTPRTVGQILDTPVTSLFVFHESFDYFKKDCGVDVNYFWDQVLHSQNEEIILKYYNLKNQFSTIKVGKETFNI